MNFKNKSFFQSFKNACSGINISFGSERNIKIQIILMVGAIVIGKVLGLSTLEWISIILASTFVIGTEMINTAIEFTIDIICHDKFHPLAKKAKDIAAGAVLIASLGALIVGGLVILPKIIVIIK